MMMIVRKNPGLKNILMQHLDGGKDKNEDGKVKKREHNEEADKINSVTVKQELISQSTTQPEDKEEEEEDTFSDMGDYI